MLKERIGRHKALLPAGSAQKRNASSVASKVNPASASAPSQRIRPLRISTEAPSSKTITSTANKGAGASPKCCISAMAPGKSPSLTSPPCK